MLDLFGCVSISTDDVELWLDSLPNISNGTAPTRREQYAKNYDLASIITAAKLDGRFELLNIQQKVKNYRHKVSNYLCIKLMPS